MSTAAPAAHAEIGNFNEVLTKIREVNVAPDQVQQAITDVVAEVRAKLQGHPHLDSVLIAQSLQLRNEALTGIDHRVEMIRYLASAEIAFQKLGLAQEGDPNIDADAMKAAVDKFMHESEADRAAMTQPLGTIADTVIELQRVLEEAYEREVVVAITGAVNDEDAIGHVCRLIDHTSGGTGTCDQEKIHRYLLKLEESALTELEADLATNPMKEPILRLLRRARNMLEVASISGAPRLMRLGSVVMKAATATKLGDLPVDGWYQEIVERAKAVTGGKGGVVDLNTSTGVRFVVYVDENGARTALLKEVPKQYGDTLPATEVEKILRGEQDHAEREHPNSAPIYAHVYEVGEVLDAFRLMRDGDRCLCAVMTGDGPTEATMVKRGGTFEYADAVDGAPDAAAVYANPGVNMLPWSLRFDLNGSHATLAATA
jgi:hypothetical protein